MILKEIGGEGSKDAQVKNYERQKGKVERERERDKERKKERTKGRKRGRERYKERNK